MLAVDLGTGGPKVGLVTDRRDRLAGASAGDHRVGRPRRHPGRRGMVGAGCGDGPTGPRRPACAASRSSRSRDRPVGEHGPGRRRGVHRSALPHVDGHPGRGAAGARPSSAGHVRATAPGPWPRGSATPRGVPSRSATIRSGTCSTSSRTGPRSPRRGAVVPRAGRLPRDALHRRGRGLRLSMTAAWLTDSRRLDVLEYDDVSSRWLESTRRSSLRWSRRDR